MKGLKDLLDIRQLETRIDQRIDAAGQPFHEKLDTIIEELRKLNRAVASGDAARSVDRGSARRSLRKDVAGRN